MLSKHPVNEPTSPVLLLCRGISLPSLSLCSDKIPGGAEFGLVIGRCSLNGVCPERDRPVSQLSCNKSTYL